MMIGIEALLGFAFGAGGAWAFIKQSRKDVNGLGRKLNAEIDKTQKARLAMASAIMLIAPEDKKGTVALLLADRDS